MSDTASLPAVATTVTIQMTDPVPATPPPNFNSPYTARFDITINPSMTLKSFTGTLTVPGYNAHNGTIVVCPQARIAPNAVVYEKCLQFSGITPAEIGKQGTIDVTATANDNTQGSNNWPVIVK